MHPDERAVMEARERSDVRAQKRAHRARLAADIRASEQMLAEAREAWQAQGFTVPGVQSCADCESAFEALGMRGIDVRGRLPGAPNALRRLYIGGISVTFGQFCEAYTLRLEEYDGPVCTLCFSRESMEAGWERLECEREKGVCSVFADFVSSASGTHADGQVAVAALPDAVLAVMCFRAGIDPRLLIANEQAAHTAWREAATRVAEVAAAKLPVDGVPSIKEAQEAVESVMLGAEG